MATTGTSDKSNSIQNLLTTDYVMESNRLKVWDQFPDLAPEGELEGARKGQTIDVRYIPRLPLATGTIAEKSDINPVAMSDNKFSVTINEYGNAVQDTEFLNLVQMGSAREEAVAVVSENKTSSMDRVVQRVYNGGATVLRPSGVTARTDLDATNDTLLASGVGLGFVGNITAMLRGNYAPGFSSDGKNQQKYATVVHPIAGQDFRLANGFLPALQYREGQDTIFNGELGEFFGLRVAESPQAKIYQSAGTTSQAATTLSGAVSAGATSVVVASAAGIAVGDIITIGAVETGTTETANLESVLVTAVNSTTLTVAGTGFSTGDVATPGLRYDHDNAAAVTEAAFVAAIPVFGPNSVMKAYAVPIGPDGEVRVTGPFDSLGRFVNVGWYMVAGWARTRGLWLVRGEVATSGKTVMANE